MIHIYLCEQRLLPEVWFVRPDLVPCDDTDLVAGGVKLDLGRAAHHDEGVQEVRLDAGGGEPRVVRLQEHLDT